MHAVNGVLGVPVDPQRLGWWADGAPVGAGTGTVAVDGHVDSAAAGPGALFHLTSLRPGAVVLVTTTSGQTYRFAVTARRSYLKTRGLPADLFRTDGPPRLVLITCGGPFDATSHSYLDNVVVFATPV
jgi:Sortase domain